MQYLDLRSEGWLIGSGMVESTGKRFKDRLLAPECVGAEPALNIYCLFALPL